MKSITIVILLLSVFCLKSYTQTKNNPTISISPNSLYFGEIAIGSSYTFEYSLSAMYLSEDITISVTPGQGFIVSKDGFNWSYSYILNQSEGEILDTVLYVKFTPTNETNYNTSISHISNELSINLIASGIGIGVNEAYIVLNPHEIHFGNIPIGTDSLTQFWCDVINDWPTSLSISYPTASGFSNEFGGNSIISSGTNGYYDILFTPPDIGFFEGNVVIQSSESGMTKQLYVTGNGVLPTISVNAESHNFGEVVVSNQSTEFTYIVSATDIVSNLIITAPYGFELSLTSGINFTDQIILSEQNGNVEDTQIFVRFSPLLTIPYSGNIIHETSAATTKTILLSGNGIAVGVSSLINSNNCFEVYPNPSNGIFRLKLNSNRNCEIVISDYLGRIVAHKKISYDNSIVDISDQQKGTYYITTSSTMNNCKNKIIIK